MPSLPALRMTVRQNKISSASLVLACILLPGLASANPVMLEDPLTSLGKIVRTGVVGIALAAEVALVSWLLIRICGVERRLPVVTSILILNILSYFLFIVQVLPLIGNVFLVEVLIWLAEAGIILTLARSFSPRPVTMKGALGISLAGNLVSFLIGLAL